MSKAQNIDTGGDAFPTSVVSHGMTLRDYFAGQALAHLVGSNAVALPTWDHVAAASYDAADAMLKARQSHE